MVFSALKVAWDFVDRPLKRLFGVLLMVRLVTNVFDLIGTGLMAVLVGYVVGVLSGNSQISGVAFIVEVFKLDF
jgi:hypothetical protein